MGLRARVPFLIALAALSCGGDRASPAGGEGQAASAIPIVDLDGVVAALEARRGKACLLNFWATWCPPCVAELPELVAVARRYRTRGGEVLGVSYDLMAPGVERDEVAGLVQSFLSRGDLELATVIFDGPDYDAINERFDLPGAVPVTIAFDEDGREVDRAVGQADEARFEAMMEKALGR